MQMIVLGYVMLISGMEIRDLESAGFSINYQESEYAISDSDLDSSDSGFQFYLNGRYSKLVQMTNIYMKILAFLIH